MAPALAAGKLVGEALAEITDGRPFFDTEHGPIHTFKDHKRTLPEAFDDEYFRHMQWAHLASGGAGGGMRWPNRHPHVLTDGMRRAQLSLSRFLPLVDWLSFGRRILNGELHADGPGCGVLWVRGCAAGGALAVAEGAFAGGWAGGRECAGAGGGVCAGAGDGAV